MEIYKCHEHDGDWVIRRHHSNGYEGVGVANGEIEARSICAGMNASIRLVLWSDEERDNPLWLSMAVDTAKRAVQPMRQPQTR